MYVRILAGTIYPGDASDGETFVESISRWQENATRTESESLAEVVVADKGYHKTSELAEVQAYDSVTVFPKTGPKRGARLLEPASSSASPASLAARIR